MSRHTGFRCLETRVSYVLSQNTTGPTRPQVSGLAIRRGVLTTTAVMEARGRSCRSLPLGTDVQVADTRSGFSY